MRNYIIPKYPEYDENIRMLENTDPADADSVFNPLFSKMINNTAAIRSKFNGVTMKDEEILNLSNTRDYDYLSLALGGNTRVTPENPDLPISPENVASIESVGENGMINILKSGQNIWRHDAVFPIKDSSVTLNYDEIKDEYILNGTLTSTIEDLYILGAWNRVTPIFYSDSNQNFTLTIRHVSGSVIGSNNYVRATIRPLISGGSSCILSDANPDIHSITTKLTNGTYARSHFTIYKNTYDNYKFKMQLEINGKLIETSSPHPTAKSLPISIPLKGTNGNTLEPLRSIKDDKGNLVAQDKIIKKDDIWQIERNIGMNTFQKDENWTIKNNTSRSTLFLSQSNVPSAMTTYSPINCTHTLFGNYHLIYVRDEIGAYAHYTDRFIRVPNSIATTVEQFKTRLQNEAEKGTPLKMAYGLETKIYTTLHPNTQAILNNLEKTYNGTTVIMGTDEIPPLITSTYARGAMSTFNAKQISGCVVNDEIIGDRNLLTAGKTVALINSMITERLESNK